MTGRQTVTSRDDRLIERHTEGMTNVKWRRLKTKQHVHMTRRYISVRNGIQLVRYVYRANMEQTLPKQVHSDNDASEVDILGQFERLFDEFGTLRHIIGALKKM